MGLRRKKGTRGTAVAFKTRAAALKRLQVSLPEFRRLCILKGIFPHDPKKKVAGRDKTYYSVKDLRFLNHEPLLDKFREISAHGKKIRRAAGRRELSIARALERRTPVYALYHIVKERYPTLEDCAQDLDDALSTLALFASMPSALAVGVTAAHVAESGAVLDSFMCLAARERWLRKVFCSVKGFFFQVRFLGKDVLFLMPHQFPHDVDASVDFKVLLTFLELYTHQVKAFNFKAYKMHGFQYPPKANRELVLAGARFAALTPQPLAAGPDAEAADAGDAGDGEAGGSGESDAGEDGSSCGSDGDEGGAGDAGGDNCSENGRRGKRLRRRDGRRDATAAGDAADGDAVAADAGTAPSFSADESWRLMHETSAAERRIQQLFSKKRFFLGRENPRVPLLFCLRACGADEVGWQDKFSPLAETDESITHHVLDRPEIPEHLTAFASSREFVQPQWVFDSINEGVLLPTREYAPGAPLPPHLSPFVNDAGEGYVPEQRVALDQLKTATKLALNAREAGDADEEDDDVDPEDAADEIVIREREQAEEILFEREEKVRSEDNARRDAAPLVASSAAESAAKAPSLERTPDKVTRKLARKQKQKEEEKAIRKALLSSKHRRLYNRIEAGHKAASSKVEILRAKREKLKNRS